MTDRQITQGYPDAPIEMDGGRSKLFLFRGAVMMYAGDVMLAHDVAYRIGKRQREIAMPTAKEITDLYVEAWNEIYRERLNAQVFGKWGLTAEDFLSKHGSMRTNLVRQLWEQAAAVEMPDLEAVIAGVSKYGPDLWRCSGVEVANHRAIGYAAIGLGAPHVTSHLALAHYTSLMTRAEALFLVYSAKQLAERAPGVGSATDMYELGPEPNSFDSFTDLGPAILGAIYDGWHKAERAAFVTAVAAVENAMPTEMPPMPPMLDQAADAASSSPSSDSTSRSDQT